MCKPSATAGFRPAAHPPPRSNPLTCFFLWLVCLFLPPPFRRLLCLSPPVSRRIATSCFICGYMSAPFTTVLSIFAVSDIPTLRNRSRSHGLNLKTRTHKEVQKKSPQQTSRFYQFRGRSSQERKLGTDNQERQFENANTKAGSVRVDT